MRITLKLKIQLSDTELFDEDKNEFVEPESVEIELEHSLASLSKWEARTEKPFLGSTEKTFEESLAYIKDMTVTPNVPPEVYQRLSKENMEAITEYLNAKMTATWFKAEASKRQTKIITTEIIYYWMVSLNIPFECQYWHLNRLLTFIQVINQEHAPPKKRSAREIADERQALNAKRQAEVKARAAKANS